MVLFWQVGVGIVLALAGAKNLTGPWSDPAVKTLP